MNSPAGQARVAPHAGSFNPKPPSNFTAMKTSLIALTILSLGLCGHAKSLEPVDARPPSVQIALLLDTSNSMDGLIEQAKSQLWKIVNEFITAKHGGLRPELQVALFEYGKSSLSASE